MKVQFNLSPAATERHIESVRDGLREHPEKAQEVFERATAAGLRLRDLGDIRDTYRAFHDIQVPIDVERVKGVSERILSSAFPLLLSNLTVAQINDRLAAVQSVGARLVEDVDLNKGDTATFAGILVTGPADLERETETSMFPLIGASQERYDIVVREKGVRIELSQKALEDGNSVDLLNQVNKMSEIMAESVEEETLKRVTDNNGSAASPAEPYALHLNKTGTQLYTTTANSPGTRAPSGTRLTNTALVDGTDLEAARALLAAMKNERGKRVAIPWSEVLFLIPDALAGAMSSLVASENVPGVFNEVNPFGPRGIWRVGADRIVTTPKLDDLSTTAWYAGAFARQFKRVWRVRLEQISLGADTESFLQRTVAYQARMSWKFGVGATDYNRVIQMLSSTTAPTAQ